MNSKAYRPLFALIPAVASLLLTGCSSLPDKPFTGYSGQDRIHLKVAANVTDELLAAKSDEYRSIPIGTLIASNTPILARHIFDEVVDVRNGQANSNGAVAAIFTPRVAYVGQALGAGSGNEWFVDLKAEWTLSDLKGNTIWVDTIDGRSSDCIPANSKGFKDALNAALEDLLQKSQRRISSAPAIKQFAQKPSP
jgi:hypothetical protein